jgi:hypothetical protein
MNHQVQVFEVDVTGKTPVMPKLGSGFAVSAKTFDEARRLAAVRLQAEDWVVRSLSFLKEGGIAAVVEAKQPTPPQIERTQRLIRQRGAR